MADTDADWQQQLKKLGKQAKREQAQAQQARAQQPAPPVEDVDFATAVGTVTSLKPQQRYQPPHAPSPIRRRQDSLPENDMGLGVFISTAVDSDEPPRQFSQFGQGKKDIAKLLSGQLRIVSTLDLHGYTQEEAQVTLNEFIDYVQARGVCAEIIHGSGLGSRGFAPVLKTLVRRWLMAHPLVLAYVETHQNNDGAVRILLKRRWPEDN